MRDDDSADVSIKTGLTPGLGVGAEKPPETEDFVIHRDVSLRVLTRLVGTAPSCSPHLLLLLCSEHCASVNQKRPHPWSSPRHQALAEDCVRGLECEADKRLVDILTEQQCAVLRTLIDELQPRLERFSDHPASVASLSWLVGQVPHPHLSQVVPRLLPHLLNITDSWMPYYKVAGACLMGHVIRNSPASELRFYGRAELLAESLGRLLSQTETEVVEAASEPLLSLTSIRHEDTRPSEPGPGDVLMQELLTKLELASDCTRREVLASMLESLVTILGLGTARWVTSLTRAITGLLAFSPPSSVFRTLSSVARLCPNCVARELDSLLPALVRFVYQMSWREDPGDPGVSVSLASICILELATCDLEAARLLFHDLETLAPVNKTFDTLVTEIVSVVTPS